MLMPETIRELLNAGADDDVAITDPTIDNYVPKSTG